VKKRFLIERGRGKNTGNRKKASGGALIAAGDWSRSGERNQCRSGSKKVKRKNQQRGSTIQEGKKEKGPQGEGIVVI